METGALARGCNHLLWCSCWPDRAAAPNASCYHHDRRLPFGSGAFFGSAVGHFSIVNVLWRCWRLQSWLWTQKRFEICQLVQEGIRHGDPPWTKATIFEPWSCARIATHLLYVRACHRCVCTCERLSLIGAIVADCATCEALKRACVEFGSVHGVGWVCGVGARVSMLAVIAGVTTLTSKHTNTFVFQTTRSRCNIASSLSCTKVGKNAFSNATD